MLEEPTRRVYRKEFAERLGVTPKWCRELEVRGVIPRGQLDPGSRRPYWPSDVVDSIVRGQPPQQHAA
jgi:hypothetical protein